MLYDISLIMPKFTPFSYVRLTRSVFVAKSFVVYSLVKVGTSIGSRVLILTLSHRSINSSKKIILVYLSNLDSIERLLHIPHLEKWRRIE